MTRNDVIGLFTNASRFVCFEEDAGRGGDEATFDVKAKILDPQNF